MADEQKSVAPVGPDDDARGAVGRPRRAGGRLRRVLRALRRVFVAGALLVALLLALAYLGRNRFVAPFVVRALAPTLERSAGLSLSVGEVAGAWFSELELRDVRVEATGDAGVLRSAALDEARVAYDLRALLRGDLAGLLALEAHGVAVDLDLTRSGAPGADADDVEPAALLADWFPGRLPSVSLDGSLRLKLDERRTLEADALRLGAAPPGADETDEDGSPLTLAATVLGTPVEVRGRLFPGARVEADLGLARIDLARVARTFAPELAEPVSGTAAIAAWAAVELDRPAAVRATFELDARQLAFGHLALVSLSASGSLEDLVLALDRVAVDAGENTITDGRLSLPLVADADAPSLARRLAGMRGRVECELRNVPALLDLADARDVPAHAVSVVLALTEDGIDVERGTIDTAGGHLTVRRGRLPLDDAHELDVELEADFEDLGELGALVQDEGWGGRLRGDVTLRGTWSAPRGVATLSGDDVLIAGARLGNVRLAAEATEAELIVSSLSADGALGHVELAGGFRFATSEIDGALSLTLLDPAFQPVLEPAVEALLAQAGLAGALTVRLDLAGTLAALAFEGRVENEALTGSAAGVAELDLTSDRARVRLDALALDDGCCGLELLRPATVTVDSGGVRVEDLALAGPAGYLTADATHGPGITCASVELHGLVPPPLLLPWLPGELDFAEGDARVELQLDASTIEADVELDLRGVAGFGFGPLDVAVAGKLGDGWLDVRSLEARDAGGLALSLAGRAPLAPLAADWLPDGELGFTGRVEVPDVTALPGLPADGPLRAGRVDAELELGGTWSGVTGGARVAARELVVRTIALGPRSEASLLGPLALDARIELADEVRIVEATLDIPGDVRAALSGRLGTAANVRAWLADGLSGFPDTELELGLDVRVDDLARFQGLSSALRTIGGAVELEVTAAGTVAAPRANGRLVLTGGELRTNTALPAIDELNAALALADGVLTIERVDGELGGAPFLLTGTIVPWPEDGDPSLDLALTGENLLLYRMSGVRVRADSDLTITGPLRAPLVAGSVGLRDGRFVQEFELLSLSGSRPTPQGRRGLQLFSIRDAPFSDLRFDVGVTSKTPFRIDTNLTQGAVRPELRLKGTGTVPIVDGTVYIDPMKVKLPSGNLSVRSGTVVFDEANPFLPTLEVRADTRLRGYDIYVRVEGTYDEPEFDLTSSPTLPEDELLLLLLTGTPPTSAGRTEDHYRQGAQDVLFYLVRDLFSSVDESDEESIADRLEVTTGGEITRNGEQTTKGTLRLFDNVFTERDSIYVVGERDVYDKINFGLQFLFRLP